jgi:hypothetical protein
LPQIGTVTSSARLSQYIVSSMRGLPCVQIAPSYSPLDKIFCTMFVMRASIIRGGDL